jgi:hypothetical protein
MDAADYERRRAYAELTKTMGRSEHVEIARILRKNGVAVSENRSGIFFDLTKVPTAVFEELLEFHEFVEQNTAELSKRDTELKAVAQDTQ